MSSQEHVMTIEDCQLKHRPLTWSIGLIYVFLTLLLVLIGWTLFSSGAALSSAEEAKSELRIYNAQQQEIQKSLNQTLVRLEIQLKEQRDEMKELRVLFEELLRKVHIGAIHLDPGTRIHNQSPTNG